MLFTCITRLASNEIFSPSKKIQREVGRAKDLSAPNVHSPTLLQQKSIVRTASHLDKQKFSGKWIFLSK